MVCALKASAARRARLRTAFNDGQNQTAREDMAVASLFGGLALANAGLGAVHGFAGPVGGNFPAPHGAVCAALLPHVMAANLRALRQRAASSDALRRYDEIARLLTGNSSATADDGVKWVGQLVSDLQIKPLGAYGVGEEHIADLVAESRDRQQHEGKSNSADAGGTGGHAASGVVSHKLKQVRSFSPEFRNRLQRVAVTPRHRRVTATPPSHF